MAITPCYKIAGPHYLFYAPYNGTDDFPTIAAAMYLGMTGAEGIRLNRETLLQDIQVDQLGQTIVDGVCQGESMELEFVLQDLNRQVVQAFMHPWNTASDAELSDSGNVALGDGITEEVMATPGKTVCSVVGTLWMYPIAGTGAYSYTAGGATTGSTARQFKGICVGPLVENFDTNPRFVPVRFRAYPFYSSGTGWKWWNWIANNTEPTHTP